MAQATMFKLEKKRQSKKTKTTMTEWAKFLTSTAHDDILSEIFTRLPNSRAAINCAAVCTRWRSLISDLEIKRRRIDHHEDSASAFTILFRAGHRAKPYRHGEFFSGESAILHGPIRSDRKARKHRYLNFLHRDARVMSSWKDLLLVQLPGPHHHLCICNPLTGQWDPLPEPRGIVDPITGHLFDADSRSYSASLVCDFESESQGLMSSYTVVLINIYDHNPEEHYLEIAVFRSKTGKWDNDLVTFFLEWSITWLHIMLVTSEGIIYLPMITTQGNEYFQIAGFDPREPRESCFGICLPQGFRNHLKDRQTHFRVTNGKMRIWQSYMDKISQRFILNVWQLNGKCEDWVSVIDVKLETQGHYNGVGYYSIVIALDPNDDNVFLFVNTFGSRLGRYDIRAGRYKEIRNFGFVSFDSYIFMLEHPYWPTQIPKLSQSAHAKYDTSSKLMIDKDSSGIQTNELVEEIAELELAIGPEERVQSMDSGHIHSRPTRTRKVPGWHKDYVRTA